MEILCPGCMSTLSSPDGRTASCAACGGQYTILFSRAPVGAPAAGATGLPPPGGMPLEGPAAMSELNGKVVVRCADCGKEFRLDPSRIGKKGQCGCGAVFEIKPADGPTSVFTGLAPLAVTPQPPATPGISVAPGPTATAPATPAAAPPPAPTSSPFGTASTVVAPSLGFAAGTRCRFHPDVPAVQKCRTCGTYICGTCDFAFPGGIHLCPTCATKPQTGLSAKRRTRVTWAYVLAVIATVSLALIFAVVAAAEGGDGGLAALVRLIELLGFAAALGGLAVGLSCYERRLSNPPTVWVAAIWNIVVAVIWLLLYLVGNLAG